MDFVAKNCNIGCKIQNWNVERLHRDKFFSNLKVRIDKSQFGPGHKWAHLEITPQSGLAQIQWIEPEPIGVGFSPLPSCLVVPGRA